VIVVPGSRQIRPPGGDPPEADLRNIYYTTPPAFVAPPEYRLAADFSCRWRPTHPTP